MTDDRYRLRPLRDARDRDERARRGDLASAIGDAASRADAVAAAETRAVAARASLSEAVSASAGTAGEAHRLASADRFVARRRRELEAARDELARAIAARDAQLGQVDAARARLVTARGEREVIERHFASWREQKRREAERKED